MRSLGVRMDRRYAGVVAEAEGIDLYHVTHTHHVPSIQKGGLRWMAAPSNWVRAGDKERYGEGEIYAFTDPHDAHRWAAKMDWEFNRKMGSGKVSVVHFKGDPDQWEPDTGDFVSQAGARGKWLKSQNPVPADRIQRIYPVEDIQALLKENLHESADAIIARKLAGLSPLHHVAGKTLQDYGYGMLGTLESALGPITRFYHQKLGEAYVVHGTGVTILGSAHIKKPDDLAREIASIGGTRRRTMEP